MTSKNLRLLGSLAVLALCAGGGATSRAQTTNAPQPPRPNVVVIETDDQTLESVRVMKNVEDLLAKQGTTFDNNFVSFSLCCPSRSTFLTGQYAHNHGVLGNSAPAGGYYKLDSSNTLPVWLQRAGYYTAHLGKYLNGYGTRNPTEIPPGWSEWHGSVDPSTYRYFGYTLNENGTLATFGSDPASYQTDVYAAKAVDIIRRRVPADQPLFLWFTPLAPHSGRPRDADDPRNLATPSPAPRHRNRFASEPLPMPPSFNEQDVSDKPIGIRSRPLLSAAAVAAIRENYQQRLESLLAVDEAVASIVNALRETGELDRTLIVFTSDNGFFHGEHRIRTGKVLLYEPSIRVPLIVRGPGVPRGRHLTQLVANIDLAPTIVDAAEAKADRKMDGRSLLPLLRDPGLEWGRDLLIERGPDSNPANVFSAIRSRNYLYAEYGNGEQELYDLAKDPYELASQHANPAYAALKASLAARLARLRTCAGASGRARPSVSLTLSYRAGAGHCARSAVRATLKGDGTARAVSFFVNRRWVKSDTKPPFRTTITRRAFPAGRWSTVRARVSFRYDRFVTVDRALPVCRR
jgi:arylsulfatase A-like enzyme